MKANNLNKEAVSFPCWFHEIVTGFVKDYKSLEQLLKSTTSAIGLLRLSPRIFKAIDTSEGGKNFSVDMYKSVENMSDIAKEEINNGFPFIYGQAAVGLWALLEATMFNIASGWIYHNKDTLEIDSIAKIKIRLGEYENLGGMERCEYIIDQLERDIGSTHKLGVGRFESLLGLFYQTKRLPDQIKKYLYELSQVRNVILHRAYIADDTFVNSCPWLNLHTGQKIKVTEEMLHRYYNAAGLYIQWTCLCVIRHLGAKEEDTFAAIAVSASKLDAKLKDRGAKGGRS